MIQKNPGHDLVALIAEDRTADRLAWNPHAKFAGVAMKHLITGNDTGGALSVHHVRIDPGCAIGDHAHAGQVEIHEVLAGGGSCTVGTREIRYVPGVIGVMPADTVHRVVAGKDGLLLLATFSPGLV
jgi:quercetin dioxygenase-like cupin family protein